MPSPRARSEFVAGVRAELPLLLGVAPFGMAYGAYAVESGISSGLAQAMSVIVFGGASQFVAVRLIVGNEAAALVVLSVLLVNLRHLLYSAALSEHVEHLGPPWRLLLSYLLTDEGYAAAAPRYRDDDRGDAHWFLLGALVALWVSWQATTAAGVFLGAAVPDGWALDFALPLTFIALVVPALSDPRALAAAVVAAIIATAGFRWEYSSGLFIAALAGVAAGATLDRMTRERRPSRREAAP